MTATATTTISSRITLVARDIKLSHTVFALPFALLAAYLAAASVAVPQLPRWEAIGLIVICMVLARTMAMAVNRWADAKIDAENPRTAGRAIPSGKLSAEFMLGVALISAGGFVAAAGAFWFLSENPWPVLCSPIVLIWLAAYSFTKRITWLCHLVLGSALALSPLAAALAIAPQTLFGPAASPEAYLLAVVVLCWVAGFDIIYALQDVQIDKQQGLHSMPAKLGVEPALWISRALHLMSFTAMIALWNYSEALGEGFLFSAAIAGALLVLEHTLVWNSKTKHIHMAFFTINGVISILLATMGVIDIMRVVN